MPLSAVSPVTQRLMACVEAFCHEEEGVIGHDDWPALAGLLERELAVLTRLAADASEPERIDPRLLARARALRERYAALERRTAAARARAAEELSGIDGAGHRLRAVHGAYGSGSHGGESFHSAAA